MSTSISFSCFEALRRVSGETVAILVVWREVIGAIARTVGDEVLKWVLNGSFRGAEDVQGSQSGSRCKIADF